MTDDPTPGRPAEPGIRALSPRQREVIELAARGLTNREIGGVLSISPATVHAHLSAAYAVLDVTNRTEATAFYLAEEAELARKETVHERPAIAVLPVASLDGERRSATVAGGVARDLVALLSRSCWFPVIDASAVRNARGGTAAENGRKLGARYLVDATLELRGATWRLNTQVADAASGHCLFAEVHDFADSDLFDARDEVLATVVARAYPHVIASIRADVARAERPARLSSWELAHASFDLHARRDRHATAEAAAGFAKVLAAEPGLVLAHYGLGLTAYDEILNQWSVTVQGLNHARELLKSSMRECLERAPQLPEGHYLQALLLQATADSKAGLEPLETAVKLNPSFAPAHGLLAHLLLAHGRLDEGLARMRLANRLGSGAYTMGLAAVHFIRNELADALTTAEQTLTGHAQYPFGRALAAAAAWHLGDRERARVHSLELYRAHPGFDVARMQRTFGHYDAMARITEALAALRADVGARS